ncbi:MAG TPA: inositol monophosphatase family protein [Thermoanaerobaculia bacterium]|nr:inositol monophosphatase family protein [Thermoanaerobaculia bacterium]
MDFDLALEEAVTAARQAGEIIAALSRDRAYEVRRKLGTELVTTADVASDDSIRQHLGARFPGHRFLSEEVAVDGEVDFSGPVWIVDPMDGTANYTHGYPYVSISVALAIDGDPCVGVVHAPFLAETYAAVRGGGATCNGLPIRVSDVSELHRALVGTGFPHDRSDVAPAIERLRRLVTECQDIRRAGSPALDICWVAAGRLDAHTESLAPWDIAAAGLIATEAGARRGNLSSGLSPWPPALRGEEFIVATPRLFQPLWELLTRVGGSHGVA